uniref:Uncharacterized protein n=1 Tax=Oryza rufipogon TaxID=4529 RepID=A0A0E0PGQ3_ORYRU
MYVTKLRQLDLNLNLEKNRKCESQAGEERQKNKCSRSAHRPASSTQLVGAFPTEGLIPEDHVVAMVPLDPEAEEVEHLEKSEEIQRRTLLGTQLLKRVVGEVYNSKQK